MWHSMHPVRDCQVTCQGWRPLDHIRGPVRPGPCHVYLLSILGSCLEFFLAKCLFHKLKFFFDPIILSLWWCIGCVWWDSRKTAKVPLHENYYRTTLIDGEGDSVRCQNDFLVNKNLWRNCAFLYFIFLMLFLFIKKFSNNYTLFHWNEYLKFYR